MDKIKTKIKAQLRKRPRNKYEILGFEPNGLKTKLKLVFLKQMDHNEM